MVQLVSHWLDVDIEPYLRSTIGAKYISLKLYEMQDAILGGQEDLGEVALGRG